MHLITILPTSHVIKGWDEFTITLKDRVVEGKARSRDIKLINEFIDNHFNEIMMLWDKAQRGEGMVNIERYVTCFKR